MSKTYCYDIDGTLCTKGCEYKDAKPFKRVIQHLNKLKSEGNTIILFTSRGSVSGKDWRELTEKQVKSWGVNYDVLILGKPHADVFIDDRSYNIGDWIGINCLE